MLRMLGIKPKGISPQLRAKLPQVQASVEMVVPGGGPRGAVSVETMSEKAFTVDALPGLRGGQTAVFTYQNAAGKFRFSARCSAIKGHHATFALPQRVETIQLLTESHKRAAVRLDATVVGHWRYAAGGKGVGEWVRSSITDISRTGASLIVDRELRQGSYVEIRFSVSSTAAPLALLGEVMRASKIEASGKVSLGLRFHGLKAEEDRAIMEFINKRQAERRSRGLA
jgi:c-di-GMP-binding flagellar brake protein YcgR